VFPAKTSQPRRRPAATIDRWKWNGRQCIHRYRPEIPGGGQTSKPGIGLPVAACLGFGPESGVIFWGGLVVAATPTTYSVAVVDPNKLGI